MLTRNAHQLEAMTCYDSLEEFPTLHQAFLVVARLNIYLHSIENAATRDPRSIC